MSDFKVVILGAGISGLTAAYRLLRWNLDRPEGMPQLDVEILEASDRAGGVIASRLQESGTHEYVLEEGPDSIISAKPQGIELCEELGLGGRLIPTSKLNRKSKIARDGELHGLPEGFVMLAPSRLIPFAGTPLLSWHGKARAMMDLVLPRRSDDSDESVGQFVRRRFGCEIADRIAQPMVGGIYVGDIERLSARAAIANFVALEKRYGSVIAGLMSERGGNSQAASRTVSGARYSMFFSLDGGLSVLVDELVRRIGSSRIRFGRRVDSIVELKSARVRRWKVKTGEEEVDADAVISALPARHIAGLIGDVDSELAVELGSIQAASSCVINLMYRKADFPREPDCFGFVVPPGERRSVIAISFPGIKYTDREPPGFVSVRAFMGGVFAPSLLELSDEELIERARGDLEYFLGVKTAPLHTLVSRWKHSMPQYNLGHLERVDRIEKQVSRLEGFYLCGNSYRGVGIPDCIASATRATSLLVDRLEKSFAEIP